MSEDFEISCQQDSDDRDDQNQKSSDESNSDCIVKLRGLPWSATQKDILNFFDDCEVVDERNGIHIIMSRDNRPSGEAYVEFATPEDLEKALKKDRCHMGSRYIEVFRTKQSRFEWAIRNQFSEQDACVKLRGLPFHCTKDDIVAFFKDLKIVPNGITLLKDGTCRANGEAFVQFASMDDADQALKKHREKIEYRYIEIFRSCLDDIRRYQDRMNYANSGGRGGSGYGSNRPGPYDRNAGSRMNRYQSNSRGSGMNEPWNGNSNMRMNNMGRGIGPLMPRLNSGGMGGGMMNSRMGDNSPMSNGLINNRLSNMNGSGMGMGNGRMMGGGNMGMRNTPGNRFMGRGNDNWLGSGGGGSGYSTNGSGDFMDGEHFIHMRGLPFKARTCDIIDFFRPIVPIDVRIKFEPNGRPTGTADVEFSSHADALDAMTKDRQNMDNRYIELFMGSGPGKNRDY